MSRLKQVLAAIAVPYSACFVGLFILAGIFAASAPKCQEGGQNAWNCGYANGFYMVLTTFHGITFGDVIPQTVGQVAAVSIAASLGFLWPLQVVLSLLQMTSQARLARLGAKMLAFIYVQLAVVGNLIFAFILVKTEAEHLAEHHGDSHNMTFVTLCEQSVDAAARWSNSTKEDFPSHCDFGAMFYFVWMSFHARSYGEMYPVSNNERCAVIFIPVASTLAWTLPMVFLARKYMLLLEEKSHQALQEKILRFEAEHEKDIIHENLTVHNAASDQSSYFVNSNVQGGAASQMNETNSQYPVGPRRLSSFAPTSLHSAPAMLVMVSENSVMSDGSENCSQGDCLSPSACAWVENDPLPRPISGLQPGERILCYDRLSGNLKYAGLLHVQTKSGSAEWCVVTLTDGTKLEMTADHAVQPIESPTGPADLEAPQDRMLLRTRPPVRAADLQPGSHSIMVLKVASVPVQSVQSHTDSGDRIALNVQQPERHAIFVKGPYQQGGLVQTMAVESANVSTSHCAKIQQKQTFLHVSDSRPDSGHCPNGHIQSRSAPPSVQMAASAQAHTHNSQGLGNLDDTFSSHGCVGEKDSLGFVFQVGIDEIDTTRSTPEGNTQSDLDTPRVLNSEQAESEAHEHAQALGFRSSGSLLHATGECKPCVFDNRYQFMGGKPCLKGADCEFCHESHEYEIRSKKRKMRREQRRMENGNFEQMVEL